MRSRDITRAHDGTMRGPPPAAGPAGGTFYVSIRACMQEAKAGDRKSPRTGLGRACGPFRFGGPTPPLPTGYGRPGKSRHRGKVQNRA